MFGYVLKYPNGKYAKASDYFGICEAFNLKQSCVYSSFEAANQISKVYPKFELQPIKVKLELKEFKYSFQMTGQINDILDIEEVKV